MTPCELEVLVHYYICAKQHPRLHAPAVLEAVDRFLREGVFVNTDTENGIHVTDKGRAWLNLILATPQPKIRYVDPRTGEVIKE